MRKLVTIALVVILTTPSASWADCEKCKAALAEADGVIKAQDALINLQDVELKKLFKERSELQAMLDQDQKELEDSTRTTITWGVVGVLAGALVTGYLMRTSH